MDGSSHGYEPIKLERTKRAGIEKTNKRQTHKCRVWSPRKGNMEGKGKGKKQKNEDLHWFLRAEIRD